MRGASGPAVLWHPWGVNTKRLAGVDRLARGGPDRMIGIAISVEAFEAICAMLPLGNVGYENSLRRGALIDRRNRQRLPALRYH
jgi:hypothetical protein